MHLPVGKSREELKNVLHGLSVKNNIPDSGIKITLTGGYSEDGYSLKKPNLIITQKALSFSHNDFSKGLKLVTYGHQRQLPDVKTIDYLMAIWLKPFIAEKGADDGLYHKSGIVTECPRSNIFIVTNDDRIITPADNILKGVTRKHLIAVAKGKFVVEEKNVSIEDIVKAKEVFITSTTKQVLPVLQVDDHVIGNGKTGAITLWLKEQLSQLIGVVQ